MRRRKGAAGGFHARAGPAEWRWGGSYLDAPISSGWLLPSPGIGTNTNVPGAPFIQVWVTLPQWQMLLRSGVGTRGAPALPVGARGMRSRRRRRSCPRRRYLSAQLRSLDDARSTGWRTARSNDAVWQAGRCAPKQST